MSTINRRKFLEGAAKATGAFATLTFLPRSVRGANDRIHVAVAGLHGRGTSHMREYAKMEGVELSYLIDPDSDVLARRLKDVDKMGLPIPAYYTDVRQALEDDYMDAISIATPNHWHSPMTIMACQAGKHVYVEKPGTHDIYEGRVAMAAARKYGRVVQHGTQRRSSSSQTGLVDAIQQGKFGELRVAHGYCVKPRGSIGFEPIEPPPANLDWNMWRGPAMIPDDGFHKNYVHYDWHWFWVTGNGDLGNQGVHEMDLARWAMGRGWPKRVMSIGGRFQWHDQGQTPNAQFAVFDYGDDHYIFFTVQNINYKGYQRKVSVDFYFDDASIVGGRLRAKGGQPERVRTEPGKVTPGGPFGSFIAAVRAHDPKMVNCDMTDAHLSSGLCHLANISYRLGEKVPFSRKQKAFGGNKSAYEAFEALHDILEKKCNVPVDGAQYTVGPWLQFDGRRERFVGPRANEANTFLREPNREGFEVPDVDKV